jgi:hypothetical protein
MSFGPGAYFGSFDKINGPGTLGIHDYNYGFAYAYEIVLSYLLC